MIKNTVESTEYNSYLHALKMVKLDIRFDCLSQVELHNFVTYIDWYQEYYFLGAPCKFNGAIVKINK